MMVRVEDGWILVGDGNSERARDNAINLEVGGRGDYKKQRIIMKAK